LFAIKDDFPEFLSWSDPIRTFREYVGWTRCSVTAAGLFTIAGVDKAECWDGNSDFFGLMNTVVASWGWFCDLAMDECDWNWFFAESFLEILNVQIASTLHYFANIKHMSIHIERNLQYKIH